MFRVGAEYCGMDMLGEWQRGRDWDNLEKRGHDVRLGHRRCASYRSARWIVLYHLACSGERR